MERRTVIGGTAIRLALTGLVAGYVNGLLGAGGGIIVVYAVTQLFGEGENDRNGVFAHALCVMLPLSLLSCFIYVIKGHISVNGFGVFVLPAVAGGVVGGLLLGRVRGVFLRKLFAALVTVSGILLIVR